MSKSFIVVSPGVVVLNKVEGWAEHTVSVLDDS